MAVTQLWECTQKSHFSWYIKNSEFHNMRILPQKSVIKKVKIKNWFGGIYLGSYLNDIKHYFFIKHLEVTHRHTQDLTFPSAIISLLLLQLHGRGLDGSWAASEVRAPSSVNPLIKCCKSKSQQQKGLLTLVWVACPIQCSWSTPLRRI